MVRDPKRRKRKLLKILLSGMATTILVLALMVGLLAWYLHPNCERTHGIVYSERDGQDLTFDVVRPRNPNGKGVILLVSGSWKSTPNTFEIWMAAPLLRAGFTVLAVSHLSQPRAKIQDTVGDVHRAVRFIRLHADEYGIDPENLGVTGASSGGHLSLMLATRGGPGPAGAPDPVDRESSAVQAAAVFFPVTNLLDLGTSTENMGDGGPPRSYRNSFGPEAADLDQWKQIGHEISPVYHVTKALPPVLIIHGDADTLVPLEQSQWFVQGAAEADANPVELRVRPGKGHGWLTILWDVRQFASWFEIQLSE